MASGTADLQRDLGGAIMQSIFGALLTAGYAAAVAAAIAAAPNSEEITDSVAEPAHEVVRRRGGDRASSIRSTRARSPPAAKASFLDGADWAYTAGIVAILLGAALVFFLFPKKEDEERLLAEYHAEDTGKRGRIGEKRAGLKGLCAFWLWLLRHSFHRRPHAIKKGGFKGRRQDVVSSGALVAAPGRRTSAWESPVWYAARLPGRGQGG